MEKGKASTTTNTNATTSTKYSVKEIGSKLSGLLMLNNPNESLHSHN
jgi:hypothetical protein